MKWIASIITRLKTKKQNILLWDTNPQHCNPWCDVSSGSTSHALSASSALVQWLSGRTCAWAPSGRSFQVWSNPDLTQCFVSIQTAASHGTALPVPASVHYVSHYYHSLRLDRLIQRKQYFSCWQNRTICKKCHGSETFRYNWQMPQKNFFCKTSQLEFLVCNFFAMDAILRSSTWSQLCLNLAHPIF